MLVFLWLLLVVQNKKNYASIIVGDFENKFTKIVEDAAKAGCLTDLAGARLAMVDISPPSVSPTDGEFDTSTKRKHGKKDATTVDIYCAPSFSLPRAGLHEALGSACSIIGQLLCKKPFVVIMSWALTMDKQKNSTLGSAQPADYRDWCRKVWSGKGEMHSLTVWIDGGNVLYRFFMQLLIACIRKLPDGWAFFRHLR